MFLVETKPKGSTKPLFLCRLLTNLIVHTTFFAFLAPKAEKRSLRTIP